MTLPDPIRADQPRQPAGQAPSRRCATGASATRRGLTLVDGAREVRRALEAGVEVVEAFVCEPLLGRRRRAGRARCARGRRDPVAITSSEAVLREAGVRRSSRGPRRGRADPGPRRSSDLDLPADPLVVVIEGVEKPGNSAPSCAAPTAPAPTRVIAASPRTDLFNPNAIRASAGHDLRACRRGRAVGRRPRLARAGTASGSWRPASDAATALHRRRPAAARSRSCSGAEAEGLDRRLARPDVEPVRLPMRGVADSLNVSVTAAVLLYEARRQRGARQARRRMTDAMDRRSTSSSSAPARPARPPPTRRASSARRSPSSIGAGSAAAARTSAACRRRPCSTAPPSHHANPATYDWPRASARRDYMVNRAADAAEPDDCGPRQGARGRRGDGLPRRRRGSSAAARSRSRHDGATHELDGAPTSSSPSGRVSKVPADRGHRPTSRLDEPRGDARPRAAAQPARPRRRPDRLRARPGLSPGSACRRRSSSPGRGSPRPTIRATPRRSGRRSSATA